MRSLPDSLQYEYGATQKLHGALLYIHQAEKAQFALLMIEEEIHIGIFPCVAARGRAEQIEMLHAERLQLGLVPSQFFDGVVAVLGVRAARPFTPIIYPDSAGTRKIPLRISSAAILVRP